MFRFWGCAVIVLNIGPKVRIILDDFNQLTYVFLLVMCVWLSHVWLCGPMDCSPPGSSVHGLFQARVLEWVDLSFSRGSSQPKDWTRVSCTACRFFTIWATGETCGPLKKGILWKKKKKKLLPKSDGDSEWELPWVFWKSPHPWPKNLTPNKTWDREDRD